ncbi:MAG: hypothetical protein ACOYK9_06095 [Chlamydiia bacterium]
MWQGLFFLVFACNFYLGTNFVIKFFDYVCQYPVEEVRIDHFDVQPGPKGTFFLEAAFLSGGKQIEYKFKEQFINEFVAEETMEGMRKEQWTVYKNSLNNELSLQRYFPMKELVHLLLAMAVSLYFGWLFVYSRRFKA